MYIKPSDSIQHNYHEVAELCRTTGEPVYLTQNGEGDLVVMDIDSFVRREKMLKLREGLLAVEESRVSEEKGFNFRDLDNYLSYIINKTIND